MSNPFDEARYLPLPELSPYLNHERYERPKEVFKQVVRKLERETKKGTSHACADIACANGELLYLIRKTFPDWTLHGYDLTPEFIECGRAYPGLDGVDLQVMDFIDLEDQFDVVTFIGTMHVMWDPEEPLLKLLSLVRNGGILMIDGCFNPYDVELRAVAMDNSREESRGKWMRDFSQHSRSGIARILEGRCRSFEFEDVVMGVELRRDPDAPHINVWTFRDTDDRVLVTNGTNMILNKTLLTIRA